MLFLASDVLVLYLHLTGSTRHLVMAAELVLIKPETVPGNTSRAKLLAEGALLEALRSGKQGFAVRTLTVKSLKIKAILYPICSYYWKEQGGSSDNGVQVFVRRNIPLRQ